MGPGVYASSREHSGTPDGFVFGAGWAKAMPFLLERPDQFRSPPPPAIDSEEYTRAFREVKEVGRFESTTRTADQTHLALWWKDFVEKSHNRLARQLVDDGLDLWRATRMFALLNMSVYDAYVNVFDNKFLYNHWRPYTAIRWASNDGNPATAAEADWTNTHRHTYAFPSYPSAHGTASAAAMEVLADSFGEDCGFTMLTAEVDSMGPLSPKIEMDPPTERSAASPRRRWSARCRGSTSVSTSATTRSTETCSGPGSAGSLWPSFSSPWSDETSPCLSRVGLELAGSEDGPARLPRGTVPEQAEGSPGQRAGGRATRRKPIEISSAALKPS